MPINLPRDKRLMGKKMDSGEFIEFLRVISWQSTSFFDTYAIVYILQIRNHQFVALQYAIEMKEFSRFKQPFTTNKYLSIVQWEEITRRIEKAAVKRGQQKDEQKLPTAGQFTVDDCFLVCFEILPKSESCINFEKLNFEYELDWFITITISRIRATAAEETTVIDLNTQIGGIEYVPTGTHVTSIVSNSSYVPSSISTIKHKTPIEYSPRADNGHGSTSSSTYTPSRIKDKRGTTNGDPQPAATEQKSSQISELFGDDSDGEIGPSDEEVETNVRKRQKLQPQESKEPFKISKPSTRHQLGKLTRADTPNPVMNQAKIDMWLSKKDFKDAQANVTQRSRMKTPQEKPSTPKSKKGGHNKPLENQNPFDLGEVMNKFDDFVSKAQQQTAAKEKRKEELKDLERLKCTDIGDQELKDSVRAFAPEVHRMFAKGIASLSEKLEYDPVLITTAGVLSGMRYAFKC